MSQGATLALIALVLIVTLLTYLARMRIQLRKSVVAPPPGAPLPATGNDAIGIDTLADPALLIGKDLRVIADNQPARRLFGDRLVKEDIRLVLRHPVVLDAVREAMAGDAAVGREVAGLGSDNGAFRVRAVDAGPDSRGARRLLLTFTDITQARLTERMRVDFIANASHELRTPLATLTGFIETLQGPAAEDEAARHRFLDIMAREAGRMSRLIDDLLSLSRIELDKYVRPRGAIDLEPLFTDVAKTLAMRLDSDERHLIVAPHADLPPVLADRDQILQVLHNLISNALKYGHTGTAIVLGAESVPAVAGRDAAVRVTIQDQGEGIAPEHLPRLTERFYRVDTSRSRKMGGTGLGLAIVKHIIERHRGQFELSSKQGEGTRVSFSLPQAGGRRDVTEG